jgi:hypothetical protein
MASMGFLWFGEKDKLIIEEIAKTHKLDVKEVEVAYKKMVEELKKEK